MLATIRGRFCVADPGDRRPLRWVSRSEASPDVVMVTGAESELGLQALFSDYGLWWFIYLRVFGVLEP